MLFGNRRVEEELERIRKANLPSEQEKIEEITDCEILSVEEAVDSVKPAESVDIGITAKDVLAMIIAAFSIVIPYALLFLGIAVLFIFLFFAR